MRRWTALALVVAGVVAGPAARAGGAPAPDGPTRSGEGDAAPADPAQEAREQYQAGMQAYQARRFVEAALHFETAAAQKAHAVTLYTAALAWEQANRPERAADDFARALDVPGPGLSAAQTQNAHDRLVALEKTMGTLEVIAPEGWKVQIDSNTQAPTPAHLHGMPGVHSLVADGPTGPVQRYDVTFELGKITPFEVSPAPEPKASAPAAASKCPDVEAEPPPPPVDHKIEARKLLGVGAFGLGVGALALGIVLGESALGARDAYHAAPTTQAYDHASALATWTDVALVGGAVLAAGGAVLFFWPTPKHARGPAALLRGAPHAGSELTLSLVPMGTGAALRGAF